MPLVFPNGQQIVPFLTQMGEDLGMDTIAYTEEYVREVIVELLELSIKANGEL